MRFLMWTLLGFILFSVSTVVIQENSIRPESSFLRMIMALIQLSMLFLYFSRHLYVRIFRLFVNPEDSFLTLLKKAFFGFLAFMYLTGLKTLYDDGYIGSVIFLSLPPVIYLLTRRFTNQTRRSRISGIILDFAAWTLIGCCMAIFSFKVLADFDELHDGHFTFFQALVSFAVIIMNFSFIFLYWTRHLYLKLYRYIIS